VFYFIQLTEIFLYQFKPYFHLQIFFTLTENNDWNTTVVATFVRFQKLPANSLRSWSKLLSSVFHSNTFSVHALTQLLPFPNIYRAKWGRVISTLVMSWLRAYTSQLRKTIIVKAHRLRFISKCKFFGSSLQMFFIDHQTDTDRMSIHHNKIHITLSKNVF